ncbi:hypothetical protein BZM27_54400, partial [Paraburkholderia steynii]
MILESGSGSSMVTGDNNTVSGAAVRDGYVGISGTGNTVTVGDGSYAEDWGIGNTITIGANGRFQGHGAGSTVYATHGGDDLMLRGSGEIAYANDDTIELGSDLATVSGNNNQISTMGLSGGAQTLNLGGSNNTVTLDRGLQVVTSLGSVSESEDGTVVLNGGVVPGGATLTGGVLSVQLGNGNVATLSGVSSGTQIEYVDATGAASW